MGIINRDTDKIRDNLELLNKELNELYAYFEDIEDANDKFIRICEGIFRDRYKTKLDSLNKNMQYMIDKKTEIVSYVNNIIVSAGGTGVVTTPLFDVSKSDTSTEEPYDITKINLSDTKFTQDSTIKDLLKDYQGLDVMIKNISESGYANVPLTNENLWKAYAEYYIRVKEIDQNRIIIKTTDETKDLITWLQNTYAIEKKPFDMSSIKLDDKNIFSDAEIQELFNKNDGLESMVTDILKTGKTSVALTSPLWGAFSKFFKRAKGIDQGRDIPTKTKEEQEALDKWLKDKYASDESEVKVEENKSDSESKTSENNE